MIMNIKNNNINNLFLRIKIIFWIRILKKYVLILENMNCLNSKKKILILKNIECFDIEFITQ